MCVEYTGSWRGVPGCRGPLDEVGRKKSIFRPSGELKEGPAKLPPSASPQKETQKERSCVRTREGIA